MGICVRRRQSESTHLFPQTELRLTCHRCTVLVDTPSSSRAARHATRGSNSNKFADCQLCLRLTTRVATSAAERLSTLLPIFTFAAYIAASSRHEIRNER